MGKPENSPPDGQSVEQLLSSIRQAIEADSRQQPDIAPLRPSLDAASPAPGTVPPAPRVRVSATVRQPAPPPVQPAPEAVNTDDKRSARDVRRGPGYLSQNPYRFRYSLEGSATYMNLRNRLSSLGQRTRADTGRSMASLLGGDVRREEQRAKAYPPAPPQQPEPAPYQPSQGLRSSLPPAEDYVEDFVATELASGTVSYSPDYHEWSLDQSFDTYAPEEPEQYEVQLQPQPEQAYVLPGTVAEEPLEELDIQYAAYAGPEPEPEPGPQPAPDEGQGQLPLEAMIRQIIEPEVASWFDEHMPDHVARAMPDEDAFIAMIRPLIEDWLADNLAPIVEQAVKDEIARITGLKR